jgi:formylglycine-generating enzyme required for sulfatase activity
MAYTFFMAAVLLGGAPDAAASPSPTEFAALFSEGAVDRRRMEDDVAREIASAAGAPTFLRAREGRFLDPAGRPVPGRLRVLWCHQGEPEQRPLLADPPTIAALREHLDRGGGLLLTGAAASWLPALGLGAVGTAPLTFGNDRAQFGLIPEAPGHRLFAGIDLDRGVAWFDNAAFPTFADFEASGGAQGKGILLARNPGGPPTPLLEIPAGKGRAIALAWRFSPLIDSAPRTYRQNAVRLTANLLAYLARPEGWRKPEEAEAGAPPGIPENSWRSLELAIEDLRRTFGDRYPKGSAFLDRLAALRKVHDAALKGGAPGDPAAAIGSIRAALEALRAEALLANPLLDFDRLLVVKRSLANLGLPTNYQSNSSLPRTGIDNEIAVLSPVRPGGRLATVWRPEGGRFAGDVDLAFDADRILFSMPGASGRWGVHEMAFDGSPPRELPLIREPDVDSYDACYLPDGRIVFTSTACFTGVPCVGGADHVTNLYLREADGRIRRLTVDQDHDWCPTVLNDGRALYLRWEYADTPHAFSRILFAMNPDGTGQMEYYGSGSYWPGSLFFARPIPGDPSKVVAIAGGHHELPRMGDLVILDPARGRFEADGAVQRIPGRGRRVEPAMLDLPIAQTWPKFLHPWPLSDSCFLVSAQPAAGAPWGIYLVDVFDNVLLLREEPGYALLEPIPVRKTARPPVIPDRIDPGKDADVLIADVYSGDAMRGVPRGTVRSLRIISYEFAYQGVGAEPDSVGMDGPWDPKRILGTVPVREDGSARFRAPPYVPIAVQPLDAEGKAVQLMRSWFTAMPGETVACAGCHEGQSTTPLVRKTLAARAPPEEIRPWHGPPRGLDFRREIQPILDARCLGCHDGRAGPLGPGIPDLTDSEPAPLQKNDLTINLRARFTRSYYALRRLVRTPTKESDLHVLPPYDLHADTTRLVQMLARGHGGVRLDAEEWDRIITWIDVNAPAHGTWVDICGESRVLHQAERRRAMDRLYTGREGNGETVLPRRKATAPPVRAEPAPTPASSPAAADVLALPGWPFDAAEAARRQRGDGLPASRTVEIGEGLAIELVRIPAGEFLLGQADGLPDERPVRPVAIRRPFWMGRTEITNEQYARFDPAHRSRIENGDFIQFSPGERGWPLSRPKQPVVRVSWIRAGAFCRWLSARTGLRFDLPTEAQWEHACRAGTATPLWYGVADADFTAFANVSDASHQGIDPFSWDGRVLAIPPWRPADARFDDGARVSALAGSYRPNPWGLHDIHGNVAEWTRSAYRPYPYDEDDGRNDGRPEGKKVVRGGSWYDPPGRCRSAFRQAYRAEQPVFDVGFRVVLEDPPPETAVR